MCLFFYKQKTAYEMRISDWSSDVCSSDLRGLLRAGGSRDGDSRAEGERFRRGHACPVPHDHARSEPGQGDGEGGLPAQARLVVSPGRTEERRVGKECVVRVELGGQRIINKKLSTR